jgi:hypothetical protein
MRIRFLISGLGLASLWVMLPIDYIGNPDASLALVQNASSEFSFADCRFGISGYNVRQAGKTAPHTRSTSKIGP